MAIKRISYLLVIALWLLVWQYGLEIADAGRIATHTTPWQAFFPTPATILKTLYEQRSLLWQESLYTLIRAGLGCAFALIFALSLAVIGFIKPGFRSAISPLLFALNSFPIVGFAPAIILLFGQGSDLGIIFIAVLISYFPFYIALDNTFHSLDEGLTDVLHTLGASRQQIIKHVGFNAALPSVLTAARLAIPASVIGATMGEWLGSSHGLGRLVTIALYQLKPGLLYASLTIILCSSIALLLVLKIISPAITPWLYIHSNNRYNTANDNTTTPPKR